MLAVLDDDPTGAQGEEAVPVVVDWSAAVLRRIGVRQPRAFHLLTNSRALEPRIAYRVVRDAALAVTAELPGAHLLLRGDSTLRAHLLPEYCALRDVAFGGRDAPLLLVPALPAAGRVTRAGVHYLGDRPLHETEYARDGSFAYASARLLEWADERSGGFFPAARGREVAADADAVARALAQGPGVVVPDAAGVDDLRAIAAGLKQARDAGIEVITRCAPAFVGLLAGSTAHDFVSPSRAADGVLVVCGSHVPATTRQLRALVDRHPGSYVEVAAGALSADDGVAIANAADAVRKRLMRSGVAVVATSRDVDSAGDLAAGERVAAGLARILADVRVHADVVVSKGGITSAVNLQLGLGAREAEVVGPLADGISLWRVDTPERAQMSYVVFPGNVGGDDALADVVDALVPV